MTGLFEDAGVPVSTDGIQAKRSSVIEGLGPVAAPIFVNQLIEKFSKGDRARTLVDPRAVNIAQYYTDYLFRKNDTLQRQALQHFDFMWAPSAFAARSIGEVYDGPIFLVQPPVNLKPARRASVKDETKPFTFFYNYSVAATKRKNPQVLLDAFYHAFGGDPAFRCRLKLQFIRAAEAQRFGINEWIAKETERNPTVEFITDRLSDADMAQLYTDADCYVSPHRCEGLGLTILEAMQANVPVIATDFGGTTQVVNDETAFPITGPLMEVELGLWMDVQAEDLAKTLRTVVDHPEEARKRAAQAQVLVEDIYGKDRLVQLLKTALTAAAKLRDAKTKKRFKTPSDMPLSSDEQDGAASRQDHLVPDQRDILRYLSALKPVDISVPKRRVGRHQDGGYVVADCIPKDAIILSYGIETEVSFDLELAEAGHQILQFDHTIDAPPVTHPNMTFYQEGVAGVSKPEEKLFSVADHVAAYCATDRPLILKMDVEGAEWESFSSMREETLSRFDQIFLEFHGLHRVLRSRARAARQAVLEKLSDRFHLFHVHANNYVAPQMTHGITICPVLEVSYIRKDLAKASPSKTWYPTVFDHPNDESKHDIVLNMYPFAPTGTTS